MAEINPGKMEERAAPTYQYIRDANHNGRVTQFLVTAEPFFLRVPRPRSFLQLQLHFTEEVFDFGNHLNPTSNIQRSTSNAQAIFCCRVRSSEFDVGRSALPSLDPRQEGLEPPTDGFGDRYSTN